MSERKMLESCIPCYHARAQKFLDYITRMHLSFYLLLLYSLKGPVSVNGAESGTYGWPEFQERELQQMKSSSLGMHAVWKNMDLSSSTPVRHHLSTSAVNTAASKFLSLEEHISLLKPAKTTAHANHDDDIREIQTLQLFPLCSDDGNGANGQFFEFLPLKN